VTPLFVKVAPAAVYPDPVEFDASSVVLYPVTAYAETVFDEV